MEVIAKRNAHEPTYSDSLSLLQSTELRLQTTQEDVNIISKMIELTKLLKNEHSVSFLIMRSYSILL